MRFLQSQNIVSQPAMEIAPAGRGDRNRMCCFIEMTLTLARLRR